jgi:hypothetical protein
MGVTMTKLDPVVIFAAVVVAQAGCGSSPSRSQGTRRITKDCSPESLCSACASCFEGCLCGGGSAARCTESCASDAPSGDAGKSKPEPDAGPSPGDLPYTFVAEGFDIGPGEETFRCQDFVNPYGRDVAVLSSEAFMTVGSHHMFFFLTEQSQAGPLVECSGLSFGTYLHLAQKSESRFDYPPGVGRLVPARNGFQIMVHYLNSSTDTVHAAVAVTVHATDPDNVRIHASQIFSNTLSVSVAARSKATIKHSCAVPKDVNLFTAASHMHSHGVHYVARASDGQLLYETKDWAEPEPWTFSPPRLLKAGSTIDVACDFDNPTDQALSFGESAATNEMCIFVGGYYPALDGEAITCLF